MKLRYAFDLGTNSIGWAVYRVGGEPLRAVELIDCGVRLFSDGRNPKDGQSLAIMRRVPRSARKRRDRFLQRRDWLMTLLARHGLMPEDPSERKTLESLDPYSLRARALDEQLSPHEIGRALFHLNQRRGFKSNRITDGGQDKEKETGKIASGAAKLKAALTEQGCRTLGEFYARRQAGPVRKREAVRTRIQGEGAKALYEFYPLRELVEAEFDRIWEVQSLHHPVLMTAARHEAIRQAMFHQRSLKPPPIGRCTFNSAETRLADAQPLAQAFRIYQELNNLKIEEGLAPARPLRLDERDQLADVLIAGEDLSFGKIRKLLDLGGATKINLEEGGRDRLKGDVTAARLGGKKGKLKRLWGSLSPARRSEIIDRLLSEPEAEVLKAWLVREIGATEQEAADAVAPLPKGHIRLGPTAAARVLEQLKLEVITFAEACQRADFHHSDQRDGVCHDRLPDYREVLERSTIGGSRDRADPPDKRLGRITNPTVHIALNQLRRVVNRLIEEHGPPEQIVLELARELKQTRDDKDRAQKDNKANELANRHRTDKLEEAGQSATPGNLRLMRLWEELGPPTARNCIYTGRPIGIAELFGSEVEIEHILPFSKTLDDSMANKTLAFRDANRGKRNQAPEEAFAGAEYEAIQQRADALPPNKRWRFKPGAMERFRVKERDFLDRQLNETRHLSRLAKAYVTSVAQNQNDVWVVTGQLTALLRARWGLNSVLSDANRKVRTDHRHHAVDAVAIGVIDRWLLQRLAHAAGEREEGDDLDHITKDVPEPYAGFRDNVRERVLAIVVSYKPEHGAGGALHEDTAYGIVRGPETAEGDLVFRKAIDVLSPKEIDKVRDLNLRAKLQALREAAGGDAKTLKTALSEFGRSSGVRRVRILKAEKGFVPIADRRTGQPYKALIPGENHHMDIVERPDGVWRGYAASVFDVNRPRFRPAWLAQAPGARLVMRLHKADMVEVDDADGQRRIKRVVRISPSNNIVYLVSHTEGGDLQKRHDDPEDSFRWDFANIAKLKERNCRALRVTEMGQINYRA